MFYLVEEMIASQPEETKTKELEAVMQMFFSYAKEFGCEDLVFWDSDFEEYFLTVDFDQDPALERIVREHEESVFWRQLPQQLAARDIVKKYGEDALCQQVPFPLQVAFMAHMDKYMEEFS